jgi:hypothetical protein
LGEFLSGFKSLAFTFYWVLPETEKMLHEMFQKKGYFEGLVCNINQILNEMQANGKDLFKK